MSKTVDQRVVSMQFDNKNFEHRAAQSMSTLDKLKQKLNLSGAAKGLNEVNAAAKKINFSEMENAAYKSGFHIQDIWLKTASVLEYQVARKIVNAGKRILSELTTAPVGDGWREYEMTLNAVQTTMAATGKTATEVEKELQKLDEYADKTVYSTADMLNNLPKFTNAGVELETATQAMIGIANATALAGGDAGKASIAFYNLGQAIGTGYLTRMDYNSINNAGIATMQWKEAMVEAAIAQGTLTKVGEDAYQAGNKTLTLQQLFIDGLQEQWATTDVMLKVFGDYGDETTTIGKKAYAAAQNVKTFTMMMESLKATAGTGWKETWQIIFGGLDEATKFWTGLTNAISKIITGMAEWRNRLLEGALGSPIAKMAEHMKTITDVATGASDAMKDLGAVVDQVINGDFGNGQKRWDELTAAGYDWAKVQNLVNEKLGDSTRHQEQATEATQEAVETTQELNEAKLEELGLTKDEIEVYQKLQEISKRTGIPLEEINGRLLLIEAFQNIGRNLIDIFRELKNAWTETFEPLKPVKLLDLIDKFHKWTESIRFTHEQTYKLWKTFHGLFALIDIVATIVGGAFRIAFTIAKEVLSYFNLDILDVTAAIANVIIKFRDWFKSVINIKAIVAAVVPVVEKVVGALRNWIKSIKESEAFNKFTTTISKMTKAVKEWFAGMKNAENLPQYIAEGIGTAIGHVLKFIRDMIKNLGKLVTGGFKDIPNMMTDGFVGGLWDGIKRVGSAMIEFGKTIIDKICEVLGIHSPSKVFFAIAGFAIAGFVLGFRDKIGTVWPALGEFANGVVDFIKKIDFGKVFAAAGSAALVAFAYSISKAFTSIASVLDGVGDILKNAADVVTIFGKTIKRLGKAVSNSLNAMAFKQFAISIAILVGSIVVLALIANQEGMIGKLWIAVGIVASLAAIMAGLFLAITKLNSPKGVDSKTVVVNMAGLTAALLAIAGSILIIAIAAKMIGKMSWDEMAKAGVGLLVLAGIMVGLMAATQLMAKSASKSKTLNGSEKTTSDIANVGKTLTQIAGALLILVIAAKLIANMSWDEMAKAGTGLLFLAGIMVGLMAATKLLAKTKAGSINAGLQSVGKMLLQIAGSILILVIATKIIASMSWGEMAKAGVGLLVLAGLMVGLIAATQLIAKTAKGNISTGLEHTGKMLLEIALAIGILALSAKIIASMSWGDMARAVVGIAALSGIIVGLIAATKLAGGKDLKGIGITLMGMALVIGVMAASAVMLSLIDLGGLAKGIIAMGLLGAIMIAMVKATENANDVKGTMIGMAIAIGVMAASIALLSFIDPTSLAAATIALGVVMGMFTLMTSQAGKAEKAMPAIIALTAAVAVMAAALAILSLLPFAKVLGSALALSVVILAMSGVMILLKKIFSGGGAKEALQGAIVLAALAVPLLLFATALAIMSKVQNAIVNALALVVLAGAMTGLLIVLITIGGLAINALSGVVVLLAMAVPLIAFAGILAVMSNVQNAVTNTLALVLLASTMTLLLIPLSLVGAILPTALLGVVGLLAMAVPLIAFVGVLAVMSNVNNATENAQALAMLTTVLTLLLIPLSLMGALVALALLGVLALTAMAAPMLAFIGVLAVMQNIPAAAENTALLIALMSTITDMLVKISLVAPLALLGVAAITALIGVIIAIGALATAIGALMTMFPQLEEFMNKGLPILERLAGSIGTMIGNFVNGMLSSISASLPAISTNLSTFMNNLKDFITGAKAIDNSVLQGVKILAETMLILTGTSLLDRITSWFTGGSSLADFGAQLIPFGRSMKEFSDEVAGIDTEAVRAAAEAGKTIAEMASIIPNQGGIVSWFAGDNSLAAFCPNIVSFGKAMAEFSASAVTVDPEKVRAAAEAGKTIAEMASIIPNQGGIVSWFAGDNSLAAFAPQIVLFGKAMASFSSNAVNVDPESVRAAADAGKTIAEMASIIPNQGGIASWFAGDNSLAAFAPQIVLFGKAMASFSSNAVNVDPESVRAAADAGKTIVEMANIIPNQGGIASWFAGDNSLAAFAPQIVAFGKAMAEFSNEVKGIDNKSVEAASSAGKSIVEIAKTASSGGIANLGLIGEQFGEFATELVSAFDELDAVDFTAVSNLLTNLDSTLSTLNVAGKKTVDFSSDAETIVSTFVDTIISEAKNAVTAVESMLKSLISTIKGYSDEFSSAGSSLVDGFAAGITASTWKAEAKAAAMAEAALAAAKEALDINSPSKVFREVGKSVPEGFAMGIGMLGGMVESSVKDMSSGALNGTKSAIARISDVINSDIDTQPTIRPVLDLSDIKSGANSISGMFGINPSVGLMTNVGAISSMMNNRQNVGNGDIISALRDLESSLSGRTGDTYTINGITYDDGSNVSDAVKSLVRAARIERRV